jgi:hypothetical protein
MGRVKNDSDLACFGRHTILCSSPQKDSWLPNEPIARLTGHFPASLLIQAGEAFLKSDRR